VTRELLIADLRRRGEEELAALRREAEDELARFRQERKEAFESARKSLLERRRDETAGLARVRLLRAEEQARSLLAEARRTLAERLRQLACSLLPRTRAEDRDALLAALAAEAPPGPWDSVRVHPDDADRVAPLFPDSRVITDPAVEGGFILELEGGRIRLDNTLGKRLDRAWDMLAPELLRCCENEARL
jgi:vacuolar-type H+-ATPase subunit E/Vma4